MCSDDKQGEDLCLRPWAVKVAVKIDASKKEGNGWMNNAKDHGVDSVCYSLTTLS